jgi:3-deoxy-D-manno-octulosonic-acid transferase
LKACGGGLEIKNPDDFQHIMQRFISSPDTIAEAGRQSGKFVEQMTGATRKILSDVKL